MHLQCFQFYSRLRNFNIFSGDQNSHKRALYEPDKKEKCRQVVCSQRKSIMIIIGMMLFITVIALIASFARPGSLPCSESDQEMFPTTAPDVSFIDTDGNPFPWRNIRLPDKVEPLAYTLHMQPDLSKFTFTGTVSIILQAVEDVRFIVLHSKNLTLKLFDLTESETGTKLEILKTQEYIAYEQIYLELNRNLIKGLNYTLNIDFEGYLSADMTGFYRSKYTTAESIDRYVETLQIVSNFPCFVAFLFITRPVWTHWLTLL